MQSIQTAQPTTIWNKTFISIFVANMFLNLSKQMMSTLITKYADLLGASAVMVGVVSSAFAVTALIFKLIAGPVNDTFNRKYILMGSALVMAISYFGYGISSSVNHLIIFRLVQGAGQAFSATVCLALASDSLPTKKFAAGISYFSLGTVVCQTIGPTVGLALAESIGYSQTFYVGAGVMVMAAVMATRVHTTTSSARKKFRFSLNNVVAKEALLPAAMMMLMSASYSCVHAFLIIYAGDRGVDSASIGLYFTVYALVMLIARPLVGKLSDRYGLGKTLIPALCCYALAFVLISISNSLWMFLLSAVVSAFGYGTCQPSVQTLCMKSVPRERRGAASSTNYIGDDLGNLIGPVMAGTFVTQFGYTAMWRLMIIPLGIVVICLIVFRKHIAGIEKRFAAMDQLSEEA
ncbi:MAG: MFS transporter [Clostridiales bacterium]|nr:MFS transporter [Clostridiales bacterium]